MLSSVRSAQQQMGFTHCGRRRLLVNWALQKTVLAVQEVTLLTPDWADSTPAFAVGGRCTHSDDIVHQIAGLLPGDE